jgi:hypothetical protein
LGNKQLWHFVQENSLDTEKQLWHLCQLDLFFLHSRFGASTVPSSSTSSLFACP